MSIRHSVTALLPNNPAKELSSDAWNDTHDGGIDISGDTGSQTDIGTLHVLGGGGTTVAVTSGGAGIAVVTVTSSGAGSVATDPGDIADPTLATAEDVALKLNTLLANLRSAGMLA